MFSYLPLLKITAWELAQSVNCSLSVQARGPDLQISPKAHMKRPGDVAPVLHSDARETELSEPPGFTGQSAEPNGQVPAPPERLH